MADDGGHTAERAGKVINKFGSWLFLVYVADALDAAAESLNVDGTIGANTRLLRADMSIVIVADIRIFAALHPGFLRIGHSLI